MPDHMVTHFWNELRQFIGVVTAREGRKLRRDHLGIGRLGDKGTWYNPPPYVSWTPQIVRLVLGNPEHY